MAAPIGHRLAAPMLTPQAGTRVWLLYDGDCALCQRWSDWAQRRGACETITFMPCQSATELRSRADITDDQCTRYAILIEEAFDSTLTVRRAAEAVNAVLARLPGPRNFLWRALGKFYRVPGIRHVQDLCYPIAAAFRHRFSHGRCKPPQ